MAQKLPSNKFAGRPSTFIETPIIIGCIRKLPFKNPDRVCSVYFITMEVKAALHEGDNDERVMAILSQSVYQLS